MKALLVIDMLNDFIEADGALYIGSEGDKVTEYVKELTGKFREKGWPVIYICDSHERDDLEFKMFQPHCVKGTHGAEIVDGLEVKEGDKLIKKRRYSGFFGTDLDLYLREKDISEMEIVGVCTNICVLYTAMDARNLNYGVAIHRNGVASFDKAVHEFALNEAEKTLGCTMI